MGEQKVTHIIFGLGMSGLSCARYFDRIAQPYQIIDTRINPPGADKVKTLKYCQSALLGFELQKNIAVLDDCLQLIVSPGIALTNELIKQAITKNIDVCGDIEIFARQSKKPIVAITGSNGKSTVTDLTEKLIQAAGINCQKGGNIGLPVLDFLPQDEADLYLFELSSFQLDTTKSLNLRVAVLLNISEDHMDRYQSLDDYAQSKKQIFKQAQYCVFNRDDNLTYPEQRHDQDFSFSGYFDTEANGYLKNKQTVTQLVIDGDVVLSSNELAITGRHNLSNLLACFGILDCLKIKFTPQIIEAAKQYVGLSHRFQLVSRKLDCEWINDSKATNVGATVAALNSLQQQPLNKTILIAGGDSKQSDLTPLIIPINDKVSHLILLGKDAKKISQLINKPSIDFVNDMKEAVEQAKYYATSGDTILLSPACASLDMYRNFEARGDEFVMAVRNCA